MVHQTLHTIFISNFAYGFHPLVLIRAGLLRLPLGKLAKADLISTLFWIFIVGSLGFFIQPVLFLGEAVSPLGRDASEKEDGDLP
ncbi:MAG: hypothetical protein ACE5JU_13680 [Candidatus Binatia bacterium]